MTDHVSSTTYIQDELNDRLEKIATHMDSDLITLIGPINDGLDNILRVFVEDIAPRKNKLTMVLETNGYSFIKMAILVLV